VEQRWFAAGTLFLALLHVLGPLARPHQAREVLRNLRLGRALARRAPMLLAEPLEDLLGHELAEVQRRLGLPVTA
jgi:hypothetical protein